jgi:hypothetical protein
VPPEASANFGPVLDLLEPLLDLLPQAVSPAVRPSTSIDTTKNRFISPPIFTSGRLDLEALFRNESSDESKIHLSPFFQLSPEPQVVS